MAMSRTIVHNVIVKKIDEICGVATVYSEVEDSILKSIFITSITRRYEG